MKLLFVHLSLPVLNPSLADSLLPYQSLLFFFSSSQLHYSPPIFLQQRKYTPPIWRDLLQFSITLCSHLTSKIFLITSKTLNCLNFTYLSDSITLSQVKHPLRLHLPTFFLILRSNFSRIEDRTFSVIALKL